MLETAPQMPPNAAEFHAASQYFLETAAETLSAIPRLTAAEQQARAAAVKGGIQALQPAGPMQILLASQTIGHHFSVMEGFREIASQPLRPEQEAKARMVGVAQTKVVLQVLAELRRMRKDASTADELRPGLPEKAASAPSAASASPAAPSEIAAGEASIAEFEAVYARTLDILNEADAQSLSPKELAHRILEQTGSLTPAPAPASTGSRAFRRAMMKKRGEFRRAS